MTDRGTGIHITRKEGTRWYVSWGIRLAAILLAVIVCAILTTLLTGDNPIEVFRSFGLGAFGTKRKTWITLQETAILLSVALALTPAFRMKFWNLGGEGQILVGGLVTAIFMIYLGNKLPAVVFIPVTLVAALAAGALWGFFPAFCKAKWKTNETLFTLMMNYVATQIVAFFIVKQAPKGSGKIGIINQQSQAGWLPVLGNKYILNILIIALLTAFIYIYMKYTKQGYEIAVVGESEPTARYVGIKVSRTIIRTVCLSGAICGLTGFLLVSSINHTVTTSIGGGRGFTAVLVAWLAHFNPIGMIFASLLIVFMDQGAGEIASTFSLNESFGDILTGIILFFIIGSEFFIHYRVHFGTKKEAEGNV